MLKSNYKPNLLMFVLLFLFLFQENAYAFTEYEIVQDGDLINRRYYDPSIDMFVHSFKAYRVDRIQVSFHGRDIYDPNANTTTVKDWSGLQWTGDFYTTCNGRYLLEFFDRTGARIHAEYYNVRMLADPICDSDAGMDKGSGGNGNCFCDCFFQSDGFRDQMDKLEQIRQAIPPAPNWQQVANIMRDTIVPRLIADMEVMLGRAPAPPPMPANVNVPPIPPPEKPPMPKDYMDLINQKTPPRRSHDQLEDAGFQADDIKNNAPEIEFREDDTGGFKIDNPIDSLPDLAFDDFPMPGQGAGEWEQTYKDLELNPPNDVDTDFQPPTNPPIPDQGNDLPPMPDEPNNQAPIPDGSYQAPVPDQSGWESVNYKPHPDAPDSN